MVTFAILFVISLVVFWLLFMYGIWRKTVAPMEETFGNMTKVLSPLYEKCTRISRKFWFFVLRKTEALFYKSLTALTRIFFILFPKAKKAFEKKDELLGLEHGPSSYFLMSVSEYKTEQEEKRSKSRRTKKNV